MLNKVAYVIPTWYTCLMTTTKGGKMEIAVKQLTKTDSGSVGRNEFAEFDAETTARKLALLEGAEAVAEAVRKITGLDITIQGMDI